MAFIKSLNDLYFPEHYRIVMIYPSVFRKRAMWCIYDTVHDCDIERISSVLVRRLLSNKSIVLDKTSILLQRDFYKATDYNIFRVSLTMAGHAPLEATVVRV